jgi:membrane protein implicated in regulation of membrane protease activity
MAWWGWVAVGALLLAAEMGLVDAEFYLVFLGLAALLVGLLALAGLGGPPWAQWLIFAFLAATSLVLFRGRIYSRLRRRAAPLHEGVDGELAVAAERIEAGARGRAELRGARWTVENDGPGPLAAGESARVVRADGLLLHVRGESKPAAGGTEGV